MNDVEALYLRIHDTPDSQAYISMETREAKHLTQYAYSLYTALRAAQTEIERLKERACHCPYCRNE